MDSSINSTESQPTRQGSCYTDIGAETIHSLTLGSGPPLVLIHGLGASGNWWQRNIAALAQKHELHIVDLAGCGRSSGRLTLRQAAEQLATWMALTGLRRASIIGHSMGGFIAARIAALHPQLIDQLVLVNAAMSMKGMGGGLPLIWRMPVPLSIIPLALGDIVRVGIDSIARATYELATTDMGPTLAQVFSKTLLIWGEHDQLVPLRVARAARRHIPSAKLAIIGNAGHVPMWDRPKAFNETVLSFLAGGPISAEIAA